MVVVTVDLPCPYAFACGDEEEREGEGSSRVVEDRMVKGREGGSGMAAGEREEDRREGGGREAAYQPHCLAVPLPPPTIPDHVAADSAWPVPCDH